MLPAKAAPKPPPCAEGCRPTTIAHPGLTKADHTVFGLSLPIADDQDIAVNSALRELVREGCSRVEGFPCLSQACIMRGNQPGSFAKDGPRRLNVERRAACRGCERSVNPPGPASLFRATHCPTVGWPPASSGFRFQLLLCATPRHTPRRDHYGDARRIQSTTTTTAVCATGRGNVRTPQARRWACLTVFRFFCYHCWWRRA